MSDDLATYCEPSQRRDKRHSWQFWGDDPYIECVYCYELRDALTGRTVRPARPPDVT